MSEIIAIEQLNAKISETGNLTGEIEEKSSLVGTVSRPVVYYTMEFDAVENLASAKEIVKGYQAYNQKGAVLTGTLDIDALAALTDLDEEVE